MQNAVGKEPCTLAIAAAGVCKLSLLERFIGRIDMEVLSHFASVSSVMGWCPVRLIVQIWKLRIQSCPIVSIPSGIQSYLVVLKNHVVSGYRRLHEPRLCSHNAYFCYLSMHAGRKILGKSSEDEAKGEAPATSRSIAFCVDSHDISTNCCSFSPICDLFCNVTLLHDKSAKISITLVSKICIGPRNSLENECPGG